MIWIRADANRETGTGHVMRCLAIAAALAGQGQKVLFILADEEPAALLSAKGQEYVVLHTAYSRMEEELLFLLPMLKKEKPDLLLVDSYFVTAAYLEQVGRYTHIAYMDDRFLFPYPVDMVINYNIYGEQFPYRETALPGNREFLLGCAYVPLRKEFRKVSYTVREKAEKVLITTGGSDRYNLAGQILQYALADDRTGRLEYHVVSGAFNSNLRALQEIEADHVNVHIHRNVCNMAELMAQCDIAVTAGGSTMYELSAVGVPIVCFSFVDNQEGIVETFANKGLVCYGGNYLKEKEKMMPRIIESIRRLESQSCRAAYSRREREMVDGMGAERIAGKLSGHSEKS